MSCYIYGVTGKYCIQGAKRRARGWWWTRLHGDDAGFVRYVVPDSGNYLIRMKHKAVTISGTVV